MIPRDDTHDEFASPLGDAAEALRVYEQIVSAVTDHLSFVDVSYHYRAVNDAYLVAYQTTRDRIVGCTVPELMGEETFAKTVKPMLDRCLSGEIVRYSSWFEFVGKGRRYMEVTYFPFRRRGVVQGVVVNARDSTERRHLEDELLRIHKMEALGRLAGGVAHDFNNLLTVILSAIELQDRRLPENVPGRELVAPIREAAFRASALTRQLLTFARKQVVQPRVVEVNDVVAGVLDLLRRVVGELVRVEADLGEDVGRVEVDPGQLEQVLVNLAVNARDAMPEGGRLLIKTQRIGGAGDAEGPVVRISVRDTGMGIPEAVLPHVFEPFFSTKAESVGSGLGLATCHGIIKQSGGSIEVESAPGEGTAFHVILPETDRPLSEAPVGPADDAPSGHGAVLLAEDDSLVRGAAVRSLRALGYDVLTSDSSEGVLRRAREHPGVIDALITDVVMPGMDGFTLARELARVRPSIRVLFTSGHVERDVRLRETLPGRSIFLPKPYSLSELGRSLQALLAQGPSPSAGPT